MCERSQSAVTRLSAPVTSSQSHPSDGFLAWTPRMPRQGSRVPSPRCQPPYESTLTLVRYRLSRCNPTPVMDATLGATSAIAAHNSVTHGCAWKGAHKMSLACSRPSPRNSTLVMDSTLEATSTITAHASDSSLTHRWLDAWVCVERNQRPCEITVKGLPAPVTSLQSHSVMDSLPGAASAITVTAT